MAAVRRSAFAFAPFSVPERGLVASVVGIFAVVNLWSAFDPTAEFPRLTELTCLILLLSFLGFRAGPWLLALLVVGQTFVKGGLDFLGGATRGAPASLSLIALGSTVGLVLLARASVRQGAPARSPTGLSRPAWDVLIAALTLGMVLLLNLPRTPLPDYGANKVAGYVIFNLVPMFFALSFLKRLEDVTQLVFALTLLGSLSALASIVYLWLTLGSPLGWGGLLKFANRDFLGLSVYGGVWLGRRVGLATLSGIAALFLVRTRRRVWLLASVVAFDLFTILISGRGPFLALTIGALVFLWMVAYRPRFYRLRQVLLLALASVILIIGALIIRGLPLVEGLLADYDASQWNKNESTYRLNFYSSAWNVFLSSPLVGVGTGGWRAYYSGPDQVQKNVYPHNIVLELGAETGLLGLIPFVVMIGIALRASLRVYRRSPDDSYGTVCAAWALGSLVTSVLNAMISGDIFRNDLLWLSAGVAGALGGIQRQAEVRR